MRAQTIFERGIVMVVIYASNSGYTAEYAKLLAKALDVPAYSVKNIPACHKKSEVIFLGWLMAGNVVGYKKAASFCNVKAVVGVGMGPETPEMATGLRSKMHIRPEVPVWYLQGGFDIRKLKGPFKLIMKIKCKDILKNLQSIPSRSAGQEATYKMVTEGYSVVSAEKLEPVIAWAKR